jgi:hypothetical protein
VMELNRAGTISAAVETLSDGNGKIVDHWNEKHGHYLDTCNDCVANFLKLQICPYFHFFHTCNL